MAKNKYSMQFNKKIGKFIFKKIGKVTSLFVIFLNTLPITSFLSISVLYTIGSFTPLPAVFYGITLGIAVVMCLSMFLSVFSTDGFLGPLVIVVKLATIFKDRHIIQNFRNLFGHDKEKLFDATFVKDNGETMTKKEIQQKVKEFIAIYEKYEDIENMQEIADKVSNFEREEILEYIETIKADYDDFMKNINTMNDVKIEQDKVESAQKLDKEVQEILIKKQEYMLKR